MPSLEETLRDALVEAKEKIKEQNAVLQQLMVEPTVQGLVVSITLGKVLVSLPGNGLIEVAFPALPVNGKDLSKLIKVGALVRVITDPTVAILDVLSLNNPAGELVLVTKTMAAQQIEVDMGGAVRIVHSSPSIKVPEVGDRVMIDDNGHLAFKNFGPDESKFSFQGTTGVSWDDIGGLNEAKDILREAVELPFKHAALYKKYGKRPVRGVLLYGPPGCGKTLLAKATATAISDVHKAAAADTGFIYVKGPEMLDKWVGNTEAQIRSLFARARKHYQKAGYPATIFIDEADAILGKRGGQNNILTSTVVPQFLSEMDGLDESGAIVLLATNRPDTLDSAVTRDGRIDLKARVSRPDQAGTEEIFKLYLKKSPLSKGMKLDNAAQMAATYLFSPSFKFYDLFPENGEIAHFTLKDMVNGAMIAGMVDKATTTALRREIHDPKSSSGLTLDDLYLAASSIYVQNLHLNHEEEMTEFVENAKVSYKQIVKASTNKEQANV